MRGKKTGGIKAGDVVCLPSGGPLMTVNEVNLDGNACCLWFVCGERHTGWFHFNALRIYQKEKQQ